MNLRLSPFGYARDFRPQRRRGFITPQSSMPAMLSAWIAGASMVYLVRWWNYRWFLWKGCAGGYEALRADFFRRPASKTNGSANCPRKPPMAEFKRRSLPR